MVALGERSSLRARPGGPLPPAPGGFRGAAAGCGAERWGRWPRGTRGCRRLRLAAGGPAHRVLLEAGDSIVAGAGHGGPGR